MKQRRARRHLCAPWLWERSRPSPSLTPYQAFVVNSRGVPHAQPLMLAVAGGYLLPSLIGLNEPLNKPLNDPHNTCLASRARTHSHTSWRVSCCCRSACWPCSNSPKPCSSNRRSVDSLSSSSRTFSIAGSTNCQCSFTSRKGGERIGQPPPTVLAFLPPISPSEAPPLAPCSNPSLSRSAFLTHLKILDQQPDEVVTSLGS